MASTPKSGSKNLTFAMKRQRRARQVADDACTIEISAPGKGKREVRFGAVKISAGKIDPEAVKRNVAAGQNVLERAAAVFSKPGVVISLGRDVPLFSADEKDPHLLVRELNGKIDRGIIKNGRFEVVD